MAPLTADRDTQSKESGVQKYPVAAITEIFKGSMVAVDDDGFAVPASNTAALRVVGVADEHIDNSSGADGDKDIRIVSGRSYRFAASSITQAMVGDLMYVVDDQTFDETSPGQAVPAGRLVEFVSVTEGWVFIPNGGLRKAGLAAATYDATEAAILNDLLT